MRGLVEERVEERVYQKRLQVRGQKVYYVKIFSIFTGIFEDCVSSLTWDFNSSDFNS